MEEELSIVERIKRLGWAVYREAMAHERAVLPSWQGLTAQDSVLLEALFQSVVKHPLGEEGDPTLLADVHDEAVTALRAEGHQEDTLDEMPPEVAQARLVMLGTMLTALEVWTGVSEAALVEVRGGSPDLGDVTGMDSIMVPPAPGDQAAVEEVQQETAD